MRISVILPIILLIVLISSQVISYPRLSLEQTQSCNNCHINPNGGGMRNEFGNYSVAFNELVLPQTKKLFLKMYKSPRLSDVSTIGFDSRYLIFDGGRIFRMQTDFFINLEPLKNFNFNIRFGEDPFGKAGVFEGYGLLSSNSKNSYLMIGRFRPAYGLRIANHKAYIREKTGHVPYSYMDGLSIGGNFKNILISTGIFNPNNTLLYNLNVNKFFNKDNIGLLLGSSYQYVESPNTNIGFHESKGVYWGIAYDRFSLLSEYDLTGKDNDTAIVFADLTCRIEYGLYASVEYNYFDGDRNLIDGVEENIRLSLAIYPMPFVLVEPSYISYTKGSLKGEKDFYVQFHLGY